MEAFQYEFFRNAFIAGIFASILCGIIGSLVVSRRLVSIAGGIAHASFGGIGLGYLLKINPSYGAFVFAVISSLLIGLFSKKVKDRLDTSIGIIWAFGMSVGIICIGLAKGYAPDLFTYLFGNILVVSAADIKALIIMDIAVILFFFLFYKEIVGMSFDEEFMTVRNVPVGLLSNCLLILTALTVVVLMKVVGMILVIALLSIPAAISAMMARTLKSMMLLSICFSILFISIGLFVSYYLNIPSGAAIIVVSVIFFILTAGILGFSKRKTV